MLSSIYLRTFELFIYKCLTSRHRLGSPSLLFFSFSCRVIYARPGCTVVGVARGNAGEDRTKVQRKEAERTNFRVARPTSRCRCNVTVVTKKEKSLATAIKKKKKEEEENGKSKEESRKNDFVELTVSYCTGVKSKGQRLWKESEK